MPNNPIPPPPRRLEPTLIYSWDESQDQAIERNKELFARGLIQLHDFERRVGTILRERN